MEINNKISKKKKNVLSTFLFSFQVVSDYITQQSMIAGMAR